MQPVTMIVTMSDGGLFKIDKDPFSLMIGFQQNSSAELEAGGVLLGRFIIDSKNIVVDRVTVPMKGDKRTRYTYTREASVHQKAITKVWEESSGTCNYLGEWHTHPEMRPKPSSQDIKNWREILRHGIFSGLCLYFVIVGIKEVRVWEGNRETAELKRLM